MNDQPFADLVQQLDDILEEERAVVLSGELEKMTDVVARKEAAIDRLAELEATDSAALGALNAKLRRNQALLDQALEGIRSVAQRLAALRRVRRSLDTYDAQGEKHTLDLEKPVTMEKRA